MLFVPDPEEEQSERQKEFVKACKRIDALVEQWLREGKEATQKRLQKLREDNKQNPYEQT